MASDITLTNRALLQIGARAQVSSLDEGSTAANAASILWVPTYEQLGRAANWNTFRKQAILSLLKAAQGTPENPNGTTMPLPPQPWLYSYAYPSDCLKVRFLLPTYIVGSVSGTVPDTTANNAAPLMFPGNGGQVPFAVAYDVDATNNPITVILTNLTQAQCVYTVNQPNPNGWDPQFQQAFVSTLAAFLVPALSMNASLMQGMIASAEKAITAARVTDGNEGVTSQNREADWIVARGGGVGYYGLGYAGSQWYSSGEDIAWPGF